ncbi:hypothetical protein A1QE_12595 [Vibrio breoganii ZF-55]|nr:hypothetical protein A1QE_12595 [Vibrio breoganii ZF-55]
MLALVYFYSTRNDKGRRFLYGPFNMVAPREPELAPQVIVFNVFCVFDLWLVLHVVLYKRKVIAK